MVLTVVSRLAPMALAVFPEPGIDQSTPIGAEGTEFFSGSKSLIDQQPNFLTG
jgi:hypothetical protein